MVALNYSEASGNCVNDTATPEQLVPTGLYQFTSKFTER